MATFYQQQNSSHLPNPTYYRSMPTTSQYTSYKNYSVSSTFDAAFVSLEEEIINKVLNATKMDIKKQNDMMMITNCRIMEKVHYR